MNFETLLTVIESILRTSKIRKITSNATRKYIEMLKYHYYNDFIITDT